MSGSGDPPTWRWPALDFSTASALLHAHISTVVGDELTPLGEGHFTLAFSAGTRIVRVARHARAAAALQREACALPQIAASLPLPVPQPTFHAPPNCPPFTTHERVDGEVLTRERWADLPDNERAQAGADLGAFLKALHSLPVERALACGVPRHDGKAMAARVLTDAAELLAGWLGQEAWTHLRVELQRWLTPTPATTGRAVLLNCDIAPGHLLYDPATGRLSGVIDFGDLAIGGPARDFIHIYEDFGPDRLAEVLAHYPGTETGAFALEIRRWYLLEATAWTVEMREAGSPADVEHGVATIDRELASGAFPVPPRGSP